VPVDQELGLRVGVPPGRHSAQWSAGASIPEADRAVPASGGERGAVGGVGGPSMADELAVALAEIESLRAEIEQLRGLLGLTGEREAEPPIAWEPTLFAPSDSPRPQWIGGRRRR
jgi:hypothetical protein